MIEWRKLSVLADKYFKRGRYDWAIEHYQKALDIKPKYSLLWQKLGRAYKEKGDLIQAFSIYKRAYDLCSWYQGNSYWRDWFYLANSFYEEDELDKAIDVCKYGLDRINDKFVAGWGDFLILLGLIHVKKNDFEKAIDYYKSVLELYPEYDYVSRLLGIAYKLKAYKLKGDYNKALSIFHNLLDNNPNDLEILEELRQIYSQLNYNVKFVQICKKIINLDPDNKFAWNSLGDCYYCQKEYDIAVNSYKKAISIDSLFKLAWINLGFTYIDVNRYKEAEKCYKKALEIDSNYKQALLQYGYLCLGQKEYEKAISLFKKLVEVDQKDVISFLALASSFFAANYLERALKAISLGLEIDPNSRDLLDYKDKIMQEMKKG